MTDKPNRPNDTYPADNDQADEQFFDQYLQGHSSLSELYHQADAPIPSEQLDQSILTAARQQAGNNHWWHKPGSWAATIALFSLIGLLAHNTWQRDQDYIQQEGQQQAFPDARSKAESEIPPGITPARPVAERQRLETAAEESAANAAKKDTGKLRTQAAPAPAISDMMESRSSQPAGMSVQEEVVDTRGNFSVRSKAMSADKAQKTSATLGATTVEKRLADPDIEAGQQLQHIEQLLTDDRFDEARELFQQFRKKYPDYPLDPVILQQLSP